MRKLFRAFATFFVLLAFSTTAQSQQAKVLWWDGSPTYPGATKAADREKMARHLSNYGSGSEFTATFQHSTRRGDFAGHMQGKSYDIIIFDVTTLKAGFSKADLDALRSFYRGGHRALMLDGTLWIRNTRSHASTRFPGPNGSAAALLVNQVTAMKNNGGGIMIGTDHDEYQAGANQLLRAIVPDARFSGKTNPSRDGEFLGDTLLSTAVNARPIDILRHWESIPSQAEAPVGQFTDFMGNPVTLHSLVETSDKPGGRKKRPYISASFDPGAARTAIDSKAAPEVKQDYMPTRKSVIKN